MCDVPYNLKAHKKNPVFARNLLFIFLFSQITLMLLGILNYVVSLNVSYRVVIIYTKIICFSVFYSMLYSIH